MLTRLGIVATIAISLALPQTQTILDSTADGCPSRGCYDSEANEDTLITEGHQPPPPPPPTGGGSGPQLPPPTTGNEGPTAPGQPGALPQENIDTLCTDDLSPLACDAAPPGDPEPAPPNYPDTVGSFDMQAFRPAPQSVIGEPEHAGLIGKPTNVVANAQTHTQQGELFGFPVVARFSPVSYTFDYGDGTSITAETGGITWASTGQPQFADAPTAHAYAKRGTYTVNATVNYRAEVAFPDRIWRPVIGTISSTSTYNLQIYAAKTALVNYTCLEKPDGIGCP